MIWEDTKSGGFEVDDGWPDTNDQSEGVPRGVEEVEDRDTLILSDVAHMKDEGVVSTVVTSDYDMYGNRDQIQNAVGVDIQFIKDSVANPTLSP